MAEELNNENVGLCNDVPSFEVKLVSQPDNETVVITSADQYQDFMVAQALKTYDATNQKYSTYLSDGKTPSDTLTPEYLDNLADSAQNDLGKILKINSIIRKYINSNDIVGKTVESITSNINTEVRTQYPYAEQITGRNKTKKLKEAKLFISRFNELINLQGLIRNAVTTTFSEGNYIMYLRHENDKYQVDYYPLGVVEISDYNSNGKPTVLFNVKELRSRLQKTYKKNKKGKFFFFKDIDEEVKANYPAEVYDAFKNKDDFAKLEVEYTGVLRINNQNRKYGLSTIFRALTPLVMLETFDNADRVNSKAKSKKIIHQKLRKEVMGSEYNKPGFEEMTYAHQNFMSAWKQPTVVVTTPPSVEKIEYIEPKVEMTNVDTVNNYRSRVLATLGISFLMDSNSQSVSTANISVTQLMRNINTISEQLEMVLNGWYRKVFEDNNIGQEYCPNINIIDSEALEFAMKKELAQMLYTIFNGSLESSMSILGLDVNDEISKRRKENDQNLDEEVFYPRATSYTSSGKETKYDNPDPSGGNPRDSSNPDKEEYDDEYNKNRGGD